MDFGSPETWRWVWLLAAAGLTVGELFTGSFFLLPFAIGAAVAAATAFAGMPIGIEWAAFVAISAVASYFLIPLGRRLDRAHPQTGIGGNRLVGLEAVVLKDIPAGPSATGTIRVEREEWRAESMLGVPIPAGSTVLVRRIDGTRLVVVPLSDPPESLPAAE